LVWVGLAFIGWILLQYSLGNNEKVVRSFVVDLDGLEFDTPKFANQGNNRFVIMKLSDPMIMNLQNPNYNVWHGDSMKSSQLPFFVAYAIGTINNCPLILVKPEILKESCSHASYDFIGRAIKGDKYKFDNLYQPEYTYLDGQNRIEINF
jgi:hypothetical protein